MSDHVPVIDIAHVHGARHCYDTRTFWRTNTAAQPKCADYTDTHCVNIIDNFTLLDGDDYDNDHYANTTYTNDDVYALTCVRANVCTRRFRSRAACSGARWQCQSWAASSSRPRSRCSLCRRCMRRCSEAAIPPRTRIRRQQTYRRQIRNFCHTEALRSFSISPVKPACR